MTSLLELAEEFFNRENGKNIDQSQSGDYSKLKPDFLPETNVHAPASTPEISYKDDGTQKLQMPAIQIAGNPPVPKYIPEMNAVGTYPATNAPPAYNLEDTFNDSPISVKTPFSDLSEPRNYSQKKVIDPSVASKDIPVSPAAAGTQPASAPLSKRETITRSEDPTVRKAEEGALSKLLNPESDSQIDEQQLLNDYLLALKNSKDNEAKLATMNASALDNSRLAMLGEGLSESASKMGNLMGKPTGSTMAGFGKEAGAIEQNNVDQLRKIYQGEGPQLQLARTAQIAQMLEGIRSSRAKSALEAGKIAIPRPGAEKNDPRKFIVPGYTLAEGSLPERKEVIDLREAVVARKSFNQKMDQYIPIMKEVGGYELYGDKATRLDALSASLKADAGKLLQLGVLQKSDMDRLDDLIASSKSFKGAIYQGIQQLGETTGNSIGDTQAVDKLMESAEQLKRDFNDRVDNKAAVLMFIKNPSTPAAQPPTTGSGSAKQAPKTKSNTENVLKKYEGKRIFKDTVDGGYVSADDENDVNELNKIKNPKQNNAPRYIEVPK